MNIGQAAAVTGVPAKTIRYYESIGFIRPAVRTTAGYRVYNEAEVRVLSFIQRSRSLGFSIDEISRLLNLWEDQQRSSSEVKKIALEHIHLLEQKLEELEAMRRSLVHLAAHCDGDDRPNCPIIDALAQPKSKRMTGRWPSATRSSSPKGIGKNTAFSH